MNNPAFFKPGADGTINPLTNMLGGNNMAAIHLAKAVGGDLFLGFILLSPSPPSWRRCWA